MTTSDELILLDTNILVYAADSLSIYHQPAKSFRDKGRDGEFSICLAPQNLFEFYAVITDSRRVSQPLSPQAAAAEIASYYCHPNITTLSQAKITEAVFDLLAKRPVERQQVFDLVLVATMLANNVRKICTYNQDHFTKFDEIAVITPE